MNFIQLITGSKKEEIKKLKEELEQMKQKLDERQEAINKTNAYWKKKVHEMNRKS